MKDCIKSQKLKTSYNKANGFHMELEGKMTSAKFWHSIQQKEPNMDEKLSHYLKEQ